VRVPALGPTVPLLGPVSPRFCLVDRPRHDRGHRLDKGTPIGDRGRRGDSRPYRT
jgi:hypothetical protein